MIRKEIKIDIEKGILTGMIVSDNFNKEIIPILKWDYFENKHIKKVGKWVYSYWEKYQKAPFDNIKDVFNQKAQTLKEEEAEIIESILDNIFKTYNTQQINTEHFVDQAMDYFKMRELRIVSNNINVLLDEGKVNEAEKQVIEVNKIARITSKWIDPFEKKEIEKTFVESDGFFSFPGKLGEFIGNIERGWFVGITGSYKRGKTWFLQEIGVLSLLKHLKVAFFSLEMTGATMKKRLYKRLTSLSFEEGSFIYPCFDCLLNQYGTCKKSERINNIQLREEGEDKPEFDETSIYRPCVWCKRNSPEEYQMETWFEIIQKDFLDVYKINSDITAFQKYYGNNLRLMAYPKYTANSTDILRDLSILEQVDGFVPDVVVVDYADILKPEDSGGSKLDKIEETWVCLSRIGGEKHVMVATATQVVKGAIKKSKLEVDDSAYPVKLGQVDLMLSLNQTKLEKKSGILRVGTMMHRHKDYNEDTNCTVLQKLSHGQVILDSEM